MTLRDINLIPSADLYRSRVKSCLVRCGLGLAVGLALVFSLYGYQTRVVLSMMRPATTLSDVRIRLGATLEEISVAQNEIQRLSRQQAILEELTVHYPLSDLLRLLTAAMNPQTWLAKLEVELGDAKQIHSSMILQGYAFSHAWLADFLTRLSADPLVESVELKFAKDAKIAGLTAFSDQIVRAVHFEMACRLKEPHQ